MRRVRDGYGTPMSRGPRSFPAVIRCSTHWPGGKRDERSETVGGQRNMSAARSTPAGAGRKRRRAVEPRPIDERLTPAIRQTLEAGLSRLRGRPVRIQELHRQFSMGSSSFPTERLRVALKGERRPLLVFFKDLNPNHQMEKARPVRALDLQPGGRALQVYEIILSPARVGTLH